MVSWTVNYKSMSIGVRKKRLSHVCLACCMFFFEFFLAFGCCINFGFGMREKMGAWAPDIVAGEEGRRGGHKCCIQFLLGGTIMGTRGEREIFCKKIKLFSCISMKILETVSSVWPGAPPRRKISRK